MNSNTVNCVKDKSLIQLLKGKQNFSNIFGFYENHKVYIYGITTDNILYEFHSDNSILENHIQLIEEKQHFVDNSPQEEYSDNKNETHNNEVKIEYNNQIDFSSKIILPSLLIFLTENPQSILNVSYDLKIKSVYDTTIKKKKNSNKIPGAKIKESMID